MPRTEYQVEYGTSPSDIVGGTRTYSRLSDAKTIAKLFGKRHSYVAINEREVRPWRMLTQFINGQEVKF